VKGRVILYADKMTDSMKKAILETNRRRNKQIEFNRQHKITPKNVQRKLEDLMEIQDPLMDVHGKNKKIGEKRIKGSGSYNIEELDQAMKAAAARLDFEEAARIRDIIRTLVPQ